MSDNAESVADVNSEELYPSIELKLSQLRELVLFFQYNLSNLLLMSGGTSLLAEHARSMSTATSPDFSHAVVLAGMGTISFFIARACERKA